MESFAVVLSGHSAVKEEVTRCLDGPVPAYAIQMSAEFTGLIEALHNTVLASVVEFSLNDAGAIDLCVVARRRHLCLQAIDKEHLPA